MDNQQMMERIRRGEGFVAALDQSGGSTPRALTGYGLPADSWSSEEEMFALIHRMRCRIITSRAFSSDRIIGAILFERTMEEMVAGQAVPSFLLDRGIVPFLKVDQGLEEERDGVRLMKPIVELSNLLARAKRHGIFGTKMRSVIRAASVAGIEAIVRQQFEIGRLIANAGLLPILEPEYDIEAEDRAAGEAILAEEIARSLTELPEGRQVMLKLSLPVEPGAYRELIRHPRVARVAALSGGYSRPKACEELARNPGMIASFSRALLSDLRITMDDEEFDRALAEAIEQIYRASTSG